jgi:hypothetical protein
MFDCAQGQTGWGWWIDFFKLTIQEPTCGELPMHPRHHDKSILTTYVRYQCCVNPATQSPVGNSVDRI